VELTLQLGGKGIHEALWRIATSEDKADGGGPVFRKNVLKGGDVPSHGTQESGLLSGGESCGGQDWLGKKNNPLPYKLARRCDCLGFFFF